MTPPDAREVLPVAMLRLASDERLVEQVRAGSERAFEAIFDRHERPVLAFCRRMLGSQADAEDALQHTFLCAYRDLKRSDRSIALRPWLFTIARHRCLSVLRSRRERPLDDLPQPAGDNLDAVVGRREEVRATLADMAQLPDDQRAALVLAALGDVSHDEIARVLGCRREQVKALVFQARTALVHHRAARDASCAAIRERLCAGGLRHALVRRHLRECPGCRAFHKSLRARRGALGLLLPAVGFKRALLAVLPGVGGGAAATTGAIGGGGLAVSAIAALAIGAGGGDAVAPAVSARDVAAPRVRVEPEPRKRALAVTRPVALRRERSAAREQPTRSGSAGGVRLGAARPVEGAPAEPADPVTEVAAVERPEPPAAAPAAQEEAPVAEPPATEQPQEPPGRGQIDQPERPEPPGVAQGAPATPPGQEVRADPPAHGTAQPPGLEHAAVEHGTGRDRAAEVKQR